MQIRRIGVMWSSLRVPVNAAVLRHFELLQLSNDAAQQLQPV